MNSLSTSQLGCGRLPTTVVGNSMPIIDPLCGRGVFNARGPTARHGCLLRCPCLYMTRSRATVPSETCLPDLRNIAVGSLSLLFCWMKMRQAASRGDCGPGSSHRIFRNVEPPSTAGVPPASCGAAMRRTATRRMANSSAPPPPARGARRFGRSTRGVRLAVALAPRPVSAKMRPLNTSPPGETARMPLQGNGIPAIGGDHAGRSCRYDERRTRGAGQSPDGSRLVNAVRYAAPSGSASGIEG